MTPRTGILAIVLAAAMVYGLYEVEHAVRRLDRELKDLRTHVSQEREAIRVLSAEWSYLTQPARLQDLVARHSELRLIAPNQTVSTAALFGETDAIGDGGEAVADAAAPLPAVKPVVQGVRVTYVGGEHGRDQ